MDVRSGGVGGEKKVRGRPVLRSDGSCLVGGSASLLLSQSSLRAVFQWCWALGAVLVRGPSGLALPMGETLVHTRVESAQAQGCGLGPRPGTPVAPCRSLSGTLLKDLGVTFTSGELGGGSAPWVRRCVEECGGAEQLLAPSNHDSSRSPSIVS